MIVREERLSIDHGTPKKVELSDIELELEALSSEPGAPAKGRRTFARALTLAVYCESGDPPEVVDRLVGQIITRSSARAIVIRVEPEGARGELEAWIRAHCVMRGEADTQLCSEQITLHVRGEAIQQLCSNILNLRLGNLPLVVWWRGQPDLDSALFLELVRAGDQIIIDSAHFAAPTVQLGQLVARLKREFARVPFGDINWGRLMPWRELVAQFFDKPEHLKYLKQLSDIVLEYSSREGGNPAQAILFTMWLATMLDWEVVGGSWRRDGQDRSLRLRDQAREIRVEIRGRVDAQSPPGWLHCVTLHSTVQPEATFRVTWCEGDCATTQVKIGNKVTERVAALSIPDEVSLVCSEFDASRRDRVYHHALQILEQLLT